MGCICSLFVCCYFPHKTMLIMSNYDPDIFAVFSVVVVVCLLLVILLFLRVNYYHYY